jgi:hypothetical protein
MYTAMKKKKRCLVATACSSALLYASVAIAAQTTVLTVTANILSECKFVAGPYAMAFNSLVPGSGDAHASTTIAYQCTNGTAASSLLIDTFASPTTVHIVNTRNDSLKLPVELVWMKPSTPGVGIGGAFPVISTTVNGTIPAVEINAAAAGLYLGQFNILLSP